ncbi:phosphoadenylyl-sulfate reductase [Pararcticibacter amylolyticus]|uniref:Adenosine 5'-phosphosulfate reductase n=1 Tax=Pararcticibacter amylolyticus TaxID=2173175 RepID=A0A2U2PMJ4_9SPHI|nr:phosphoadenylyl-sulfate reductase [Pararcticibacter amylolyticus]PWG82626.1 phosphoadenylyl-sulfate reductase [Pararcticibacter amylolyticus]
MIETLNSRLGELLPRIEGLLPQDALSLLSKEFEGKIVFSTSFSWEDQVIAHMILSQALPVRIFTLDTGRLFGETYYVWSRTNEQYNTHVEAYYPNQEQIERFVTGKGPNAFYESIENRKSCCHIRKVEPLQRALSGNQLWITGLRSEHSPERGDLPQLEWDDTNKILKYHPLLHWSTEDVRSFINENGIPYNTLHDKGFVSIGCACCTRAIRPGEDFRAGRWWWEDKTTKECGLHAHS